MTSGKSFLPGRWDGLCPFSYCLTFLFSPPTESREPKNHCGTLQDLG